MAARLLALALAAAALAACGQGSKPATLSVATPEVSRAAAANSPTPAPEIRVFVTGAVARPGVYPLAPDSRIEDAITAAGGFLPGADTPRVNLAARVHDEQEIFVPKVGESVPAPASKAIDINSASAAQLRQGLGITSTLASRIVAYRRQHGPFGSVDDLKLVPVPEDQLSRIRPQITAG